MKISRGVWVVVGILLALFVLNGLMLHQLGYSRQPETDCPFPETGIWVCKELGISLFLDQGYAFVVTENDQILCSYLRERGSWKVYIRCNEFEHPQYPFEYAFFSGDFLNIDGDVFYMEEHKSGTVYAFWRAAESTD